MIKEKGMMIMKKKIILSICIIIILIVVAVPIEHFFGDNVYGAFAFAKEDVVKISENEYRTYKDKPELFTEYMENQGWKFIDRGGTILFFEKDGQQAYCDIDFKEFYAVMEVTYSNIRSIEKLKELYPEYFFEPDTFKGIEIYVWQLAEDNYKCGALPGTNAPKSNEDILDLFDKSVTIEEMNSILAYCEISKEDVRIIPCTQPLSSYIYTIDDEYTKKVEAMFDF